MYTQLIYGINVESFPNCYASSYVDFKVTHRLIPPSPLTQFFLLFFFSSFPSPRMHWASVLQLFYGCVFHRHFYSHRQTIKVCWTHARCPSAGCGSIKSIFLWKWVTVSWGGVEEDRKPRRDEIYIRSFIKPQTLQHPTLKKRSHLTFRLSQNAAWCPFSCGTMGVQWRLVPESTLSLSPKPDSPGKKDAYIQPWADFLQCHWAHPLTDL